MPVISFAYITQSLHKVAAFRKARNGANEALRKTIGNFIKSGQLIELKNVKDEGVREIRKTYGADAYLILPDGQQAD